MSAELVEANNGGEEQEENHGVAVAEPVHEVIVLLSLYSPELVKRPDNDIHDFKEVFLFCELGDGTQVVTIQEPWQPESAESSGRQCG